MSIERPFDLIINAGTSSPLVINVNQNDSGEIWKFNLYQEDGTKVIPAAGEIVGLKSDGHAIVNAGTVNESGQVVITETAQMTAAPGANVFEIVFDSVHGTANFILYVEKSPVDDDADFSESDISAIQQAIAMAISAQTVAALQIALQNEAQTRFEQDTLLRIGGENEAAIRAAADAVLRQAIDDAAIVPAGSTVVVDNTLSIEGAAADAKKTGDAVSDLNQAVNNKLSVSNTVLQTIDANEAPSGFVFVRQNSANIPVANHGYLITFQTDSDNYRMQIYSKSSNVNQEYYMRWKDNGTWAEWKTYSGDSALLTYPNYGAHTAQTIDLNDAPAGLIYAHRNSSNKPVSDVYYYFVETIYADSSNYVKQRAYSTNNNLLWERNKTAGAWGAWYIIAGRRNAFVTYVIAASNSTTDAKNSADLVCDGINDTDIINSALQVSSNVKIYFRDGTYYINKLTLETRTGKYLGLALGINAHSFKGTMILEGESPAFISSYPDYALAGGVQFVVTADAIANVPSDGVISVIGTNAINTGIGQYPQRKLMLKNIAVLLPDNQRENVTGIDFTYCAGMNIENVYVKVNKTKAELQLPASGTVGIYGLLGSKFSDYTLTNCWVLGFEKAFRLSGENIIAQNCYAYYCTYPFYLFEDNSYHSNVFIKCGEERCKHGVYFAQGMQKGLLADFIGYDMEIDPSDTVWSKIGGAVVENEANHGGGTISFCATKSRSGSFETNFFETGSGSNFKVIQAIQKIAGATADRPSMPHIWSQFFDTTLNKLLIFNGTEWIEV